MLGGTAAGLIPHRSRHFQIDFDFLAYRLALAATDGATRSMRLEARTVADFDAELMALLDDLALGTTIWAMPVEIAGAIRFDADVEHGAYDPDAIERFWPASARADELGVRGVPGALRRQGQPGAPVLGGARPCRHARFGPSGATASGRRAELRSSCDVGGLLP
jgi:Family of unknown function (DUF5996)